MIVMLLTLVILKPYIYIYMGWYYANDLIHKLSSQCSDFDDHNFPGEPHDLIYKVILLSEHQQNIRLFNHMQICANYVTSAIQLYTWWKWQLWTSKLSVQNHSCTTRGYCSCSSTYKWMVSFTHIRHVIPACNALLERERHG